MRLRRTAAGAIVVLVLAGCGSGGGNAAVTTLAETTTTTEAPTTTSVVATTTTVAPATTEAAPAPTTTVVQDATTADPDVLARQLQAVLDRYEALVTRSRSDPNLPFTDEGLISDLREVATGNFLGVFWVPKWQHDRDEGLAARLGPAGVLRLLVSSVDVVDAATVSVGYCYYDDGVTYRVSDEEVVDDRTYISRGSIRMEMRENSWRVGDLHSDSYTPSASNPCDAEAVAR